MHIPDGFLGTELCVAANVAAAGALGYAATRARRELDERRLALLAPVTAAVFAAQMLNFPVPGGTSGHLLGAALATVLLGPWLGMLAVATVLGVQALAFADGGLAALGANALNMAVAGSLVTAAVLGGARAATWSRAGFLLAAGGAAWVATMAAAALASTELVLSGTASPATVLPPMLGWHALIGAGEAAITVTAVAVVLAAREDLAGRAPAATGARRRAVAAGIATAAMVAALASPLASAHPDGLNRVAADLGFAAAERVDGLQRGAPASGYTLPGITDEQLATAGAGLAGTLAVLLLGAGLARTLRRPRAV